MSQTLVIHHDATTIDLLHLNLPIYLGTDVIIKKNFEDSKPLIENHPGIHLIICVDQIGDETTAELTLQLNTTLKRKTPLIVIGEKALLPKLPHVVCLPQADLRFILQAAAKFLKVTPEKMIEQVVPDFFPIQLSFCERIQKAPCEIFLLQGESGYVRLYDRGDAIKTKDIRQLITDGTEMIYVAAVNRLKFVNHITTELMERLKDAKLNDKGKVDAADTAMQMVKKVVNSEKEISATTQELASIAISACIDIAKKNPRVASLLKKLLANKASFLYKHTQLIIHISQHIISNIEWGTSEQKVKLAFVAFFHDICLTDDKYAHFKSDTAVEMESNLSNVEKDLITKHARMAAEIVQKFPNAPIGADIIITQHHGMTSGQGFAKTYTNNTSPLAIVFMVAEEFSHLILQYPDGTDLESKKEEMISRLKSIYGRANYLKVIDTLNSVSF